MDFSQKPKKADGAGTPSLSRHVIKLEKRSSVSALDPVLHRSSKPEEEKPRKSFLAELLQKKDEAVIEPSPPPRKSQEVEVMHSEPDYNFIPDVEPPPVPPARSREPVRRGLPSLPRPPRKPRKFNKTLFGALGGIAAIGVVVGIMSTVMAHVTITVKPRVDVVDIGEVAAVFDGTIAKSDLASHAIPAEFFEFTGSVTDEFPTTGKSNGSTRSAGTVKIYNHYSSAPQGLVASTRFITKDGVVFRITEGITIPGAKIENGKIAPQSIDVQLAADQPGPESNISGQIELRIPGFQGTPKYEGFYAVAPSGFSGGNKGTSQVVSADDIKKAQEQLTKKVFDSLKQEVVRKIPPEFKLVDGLREIEITSVDVPKENTPGSKFTGTAKAVAHAVVFHESDISGFIQSAVLKNDPAKTILADMSGVIYQLKEMTFDKKRASVTIRGSIKTSARFSEEGIAQSLAGKKESALIDALRGRKEFATFRIAFFPPWIYSAPDDPKKIKFITEKIQ